MHRNNERTSWLIVPLLAAFMLGGGCATTYRVQVDAIKSTSIAGDEESQSYRLVNANPERDDSDPEIQQVAALARTALSSKGLYEAPAGVTPDLQIEYDYAVSEPRRRVERQLLSTYVEVPARASADPTQPPPPIVRREQPIVVVVIEYEKSVRISAREAPERCPDRPPREVWSVIATSVDESDDLDRYVPILVAAAMDDIATDQPEPREVALSAADERVCFLRRGM